MGALLDIARKSVAPDQPNAGDPSDEMPDPAAEARRQRVVVKLDENPANVAGALAERAASHSAVPEPYVDRRALAHIVARFHKAAGDTDAVIGECVRDALARPEAALRCYRALMANLAAGTETRQ
ncbi:MAG: hypothetical protein HY017_25045 [Betaproteobacteria bacterium]|nr:hypothetical protein [Betaproteobacteria bacterium]